MLGVRIAVGVAVVSFLEVGANTCSSHIATPIYFMYVIKEVKKDTCDGP
jgi:hypothetical protein